MWILKTGMIAALDSLRAGARPVIILLIDEGYEFILSARDLGG